MLIARNTIVICVIEILFSFMFYLCQAPSIILSTEQMNELLLAIFGAGMGALATGVLEYINYKRNLENELLEQIEPLISGLSSIKSLALESFGDQQCSDLLYLAYLDEEESNSSNLIAKSHAARTALITAIENCREDECDRYISDVQSSNRRYLDRARSAVDEIATNYLYLDVKLENIQKTLQIIDDINYLTFNLCHRAKILKRIKDELKGIPDKYRELIGDCRLYKFGQYSQVDLIRRVKTSEKSWMDNYNSLYEENTDALSLFNLASEFAKSTTSKYYKEYKNGPWWRPFAN